MITSHDRGFLYGDGVFETVRFCHGKLVLWDFHRERLFESCDLLAIPIYVEEFDATISSALAQAPDDDCILKVVVTRGEGGRGYAPADPVTPSIVLQWHPLPQGIREFSRTGIDCIYCDHPLSLNPVTAGIKHLNRLDQVMASMQLAQAATCCPTIREGLMCDPDDYIVEGTRSNIFAVINHKLCTPDLSRAGVSGVMRRYLIEHFEAIGMPVEVRQITRQDLNLASELFVCNSVSGVWPVARIQQIKDGIARVDVEFSSRCMSDSAKNAVQKLFPI